MEESKDAKGLLACPFCGAPHRGIIPADVAQVKCEYCGEVFSVSSHFRDIAQRCPNHPQVFATGLCNDCSGNYCTRCLHVYDLRAGGDGTKLYLCPECFKKRHLKEANSFILVGAALTFCWLFFFLAAPVVGILLILFVSIPMIAYGFYKRSTLLKAPSVYDERETIFTRKAEVSESAQDVDALYGKMLSKYMMRWGALNAKELLDNEIYAYVRQGFDYVEAVRKVAQAKGIITTEEAAKAKAKEAETEEQAEPKETRKSKMVR